MSIRKFQEGVLERVSNFHLLSNLDELRFERELFVLLPLRDKSKRLVELMESDIVVYVDGAILGYNASGNMK